jgi:MFS family permease
MDRTKSALRFILLLGVISLLSDMTYEGGRSITGPYLMILGASGAAVGIIAGLGEFVGYGLRVVSGVFADRSGRYWGPTLFGYALNLLAVPALALAGRWEYAAVLIVAERLGKAIRTPARDAMLSHAADRVGRGWAFALHEALDQVGAMIGPLIVTGVLAVKGSYPWAFGVLLFPALSALVILLIARSAYPRDVRAEVEPEGRPVARLPRVFWFYLGAMALVAAGYVDFPLIAFHLKRTRIVQDQWIPLLYSGAMAMDALAALIFGRQYDRRGMPVLAVAIGVSSFFAPFVFSGNQALLFVGVGLWGIGLGAQESIMRAVVAGLVSPHRRATGYGIFNSAFGLAWFAGSALMGVLYDTYPILLILFSIVMQVASLPLIMAIHKRISGSAHIS